MNFITGGGVNYHISRKEEHLTVIDDNRRDGWGSDNIYVICRWVCTWGKGVVGYTEVWEPRLQQLTVYLSICQFHFRDRSQLPYQSNRCLCLHTLTLCAWLRAHRSWNAIHFFSIVLRNGLVLILSYKLFLTYCRKSKAALSESWNNKTNWGSGSYVITLVLYIQGSKHISKRKKKIKTLKNLPPPLIFLSFSWEISKIQWEMSSKFSATYSVSVTYSKVRIFSRVAGNTGIVANAGYTKLRFEWPIFYCYTGTTQK